MLIERRAWNGCGVKLNGYAAFWSRTACSCWGVNASALQGSGDCPVFNQAVFSYWHSAMLAAALACAAAIVGLMSESFCVNPDQLADTETLGVYAPVAARTPQRAAPSRALQAWLVEVDPLARRVRVGAGWGHAKVRRGHARDRF